jgi:hypothetical protein
MNIWMDVMRDLEHVMDDHERLFDAWALGGVDGMAIGPLVFNAPKLLKGTDPAPADGVPTMAFDPNPAVYRRFDVEPPPAPDDPAHEKRRLLERTLAAAKDHGFSVWVFQAQTGAGPVTRADTGVGTHVLGDELGLAATSARIVDTLEHYPMVDGAIMDGPEWGYEIAPHHMNRRSYIFDDLPESIAARCSELGYDYGALVDAKDSLYKALHSLRGGQIEFDSDQNPFGGFEAICGNPALSDWLRFRVDSLTAYFSSVHSRVTEEASHPVKLGAGPRTAAFAPLCGYDFEQLAQSLDILLPKHYFWHRGFDGMIGTVGRYVETLCEWNDALSDLDALAVVRALFGLNLPGVADRNDLESALSPEFYDTVVTAETERALAAVDDPGRIVPWVDAGRFPHDGDPMSSRDLRMLLEAAERAGLQRFLYHHHGNLTAGEWTVMSDICGERWDSRQSSYEPPDALVL